MQLTELSLTIHTEPHKTRSIMINLVLILLTALYNHNSEQRQLAHLSSLYFSYKTIVLLPIHLV